MTFPTVQQGIPVYPALTTAPPAAVKAKGAAVSRFNGSRVRSGHPQAETNRRTLHDAGGKRRPYCREWKPTFAPASPTQHRTRLTSEGFSGGTATADGALGGLLSVVNRRDRGHSRSHRRSSTWVEKMAEAGRRQARVLVVRHSPRGRFRTPSRRLASLFQSDFVNVSAWDYMAARLGSGPSDEPHAGGVKATDAEVGLVTLNAMRQRIKMPVWNGIRFVKDEIQQRRRRPDSRHGVPCWSDRRWSRTPRRC